MIEILKKRTIENSGLKMNKLGDCITLSNYILERHDKFISYNTLRRFFGVINSKSKPSNSTLNILSNFNGYKNYIHFCKLFVFNNKWKIQNEIYEIININNSNIFIQEIEKKINQSLDYVSIIVQVIRELILEERFDDVIKVFSLKQFEIDNMSYDEVINIANGVGNLLRKKKIKKNILLKLLKIKNYRNLVFSVYVDYSHLNGYYYNELSSLKNIEIDEQTEVFSKCMQNLTLYLNRKKIKFKKNLIKEDYHPVLKSRIISQKLFNRNKNIISELENYFHNINKTSLKIDHFYELIITSMITKSFNVMRYIIKKFDPFKKEIFLYQLRHVQHYLLMKSLYYSSIGDLKKCKKTIKDFNLFGVSESYKEFLKIFYLITMYNLSNFIDKQKILDDYNELAKKLKYPLFSSNYIKNYSQTTAKNKTITRIKLNE